MSIRHTLTAVASLGLLVVATTACTPAAQEPAAPAPETRTIVETREVAAPPVIIERPSPDIVIENGRPTGDSTTVRAGRNGIEVETTNR